MLDDNIISGNFSWSDGCNVRKNRMTILKEKVGSISLHNKEGMEGSLHTTAFYTR